ncbi:MAG: hypothetical protein ABI398_08575 [Devosia sp.]
MAAPSTRRVIFGWLTREMAGLPPWGKLPPESEMQTGKNGDASGEA